MTSTNDMVDEKYSSLRHAQAHMHCILSVGHPFLPPPVLLGERQESFRKLITMALASINFRLKTAPPPHPERPGHICEWCLVVLTYLFHAKMYVHPNIWEETLVCSSRAVAAYSVNEKEIRGLQMGTLTCMHACVYALKHASTHSDPSGPRFNFEIGTAGSLVGGW